MDALSSVFPEEQCKVGRVGSAGVSVRHKRCGEQSGDDGTEDQGGREIREHGDAEVPEDWLCDSSSVPWQPNPSEAAEGEPLGVAMTPIVCVPMVLIEDRLAVLVTELREYKAPFFTRREVEPEKFGFSDECGRCRVAQWGAEGKATWRRMPRTPLTGYDERRRGAANVACGGAANLARRTTGSGHKSRGGSGGQDEEMTEALAASSARRVRPRSAEMSRRMEDVLPSRKRGSEEVGPPEDPRLKPADW